MTSPVHDRMPVILDPVDYDLWLDPGMTNVEAASDLLKPYDARMMRSYPVSTRINHVVNDDEECSRPIEIAEVQPRLFREMKSLELLDLRCQHHECIQNSFRSSESSKMSDMEIEGCVTLAIAV